jgi:hypothetical protein
MAMSRSTFKRMTGMSPTVFRQKYQDVKAPPSPDHDFQS